MNAFAVCLFFLNFLLLAILDFHSCMWAFSSCGKQRLLSSCGVQASHCGGFSYCGAEDGI